MSADQYTEVTSQSWFSRIADSIKGILLGMLLIIAAFPVLFLNEGRAVNRYKTLKEGGSSVISVTADAVQADNEGKLVHLTGKAMTHDHLTDPTFAIDVVAIKLDRIVEMYLWQETKEEKTEKKLGGGTETVTTYDYKKTWSDRLIPSSGFKKTLGHENPTTMPYKSELQLARDVTVGEYKLSGKLTEMISGFEPVNVQSDVAIPAAIKDKAKLHDGGFYLGTNPVSPQVGDIRVRFKAVYPSDVSVVAKQSGESLESYKTQVGGTILLLQMGTVDAKAMFDKAQADNTKLTWLLRGLGFILMLVGFIIFFKPLSVLADVIPFIGNLVEGGTFLIALMLSAMLSTITIAIGWIVFRPLLGIGLLAIAGVAGFFAFKRMQAGKAKRIQKREELELSMPA